MLPITIPLSLTPKRLAAHQPLPLYLPLHLQLLARLLGEDMRAQIKHRQRTRNPRRLTSRDQRQIPPTHHPQHAKPPTNMYQFRHMLHLLGRGGGRRLEVRGSGEGKQKHEPEEDEREQHVDAERGDHEGKANERHGDVMEALRREPRNAGGTAGVAECGDERVGRIRGVREGAPVHAVDDEDGEGEGWGWVLAELRSAVGGVTGKQWADDTRRVRASHVLFPRTNSAIPATTIAPPPRK